jgi:hypothetical protein
MTTAMNKPQRGSSSGRKTNLTSTIFKRGSTPRRVFKVERYFSEFFDSDIPLDIGYDFLSSEELEVEKNDDGLKVITSLQYKQRTEKETLKYYRSVKDDVNIATENKKYTVDDTMENTRYSYLTPSIVRLGRENTNPILNRGSKMASEMYLDTLKTGISRVGFLKHSPQIPYVTKRSLIKPLGGTEEEKTTHINLAENLLTSGMLRGTIFDSKTEAKDVLVSARTVLGEQTNFSKQDLAEKEITSDGSEDIEKRASIHSTRLFSALANNEIRNGEGSSLTEQIRAKRDAIFDLGNPENGLENMKVSISHQLANSGFKVGITRTASDITEKKEEPYMKNAAVELRSHPVVEDLVKRLPNQLKSIYLNNPNAIWGAVNKNKDNSVFDLNYNIINKIEVMTNFETTLEGRQIKESIWEPLTIEKINIAVSENKNLLCRMIPYENQDLGIKRLPGMELPVYNTSFIISPEEKIVEDNRTPLNLLAKKVFDENFDITKVTRTGHLLYEDDNKTALNLEAKKVFEENFDLKKVTRTGNLLYEDDNKTALNLEAKKVFEENFDLKEVIRAGVDLNSNKTKLSTAALEAFNASGLQKTLTEPEYAANIIPGTEDSGRSPVNLIGASAASPIIAKKISEIGATTTKKYVSPTAKSAMELVLQNSFASSLFKKIG